MRRILHDVRAERAGLVLAVDAISGGEIRCGNVGQRPLVAGRLDIAEEDAPAIEVDEPSAFAE
jgi:hypothetical protein